MQKLLFSLLLLIGLFACERKVKVDYYKTYQMRVSEVTKTDMYQYINSDTLDKDTLSISYSPPFKSKRDFLSDGSFVDYNIFGPSDTDVFCSINFKVKNGIWYVHSGEKWQVFYANRKIHKVDMLYSERMLIPDNRYLLHGQEVFSLYCKYIDGSIVDHEDTYYFSPQHGIVVLGGRNYFRRQDYSPKGLDSLMESL